MGSRRGHREALAPCALQALIIVVILIVILITMINLMIMMIATVLARLSPSSKHHSGLSN